MNTNIKATNMDLSDAIREYVDKKINQISKFTKLSETCYVEIGKTTQHHQKGEVYKAEFKMNINGVEYFSVSEEVDLYKAIDEAKAEIVRQITSNKDRKQTLFKRGASSVKKMLKGISARNPFTSKY